MRSVLEVDRQRMGPSLADPRRRFGRHADARRFLAEDGGQAASPGVWAGLLTALRYHSIQDSLASLAAWEREVLHLAFVEGRTNREIAAILSISRSTVRRRIVLGLAALDEQLRRVGTKASAVLLLLLASALARARFAGRLVGSLRATPAGNVILTTAAGAAAGAMVFGAIVANQGTAAGEHAATPSFTHVTAGAPLALSAPVPEDSTGSGGPSEVTHGKTTGTSTGATGTLDPGCDGKPTNAPATTPVGPRTANGQGLSPVTHPAAGGCGPHGVERT